MATRTGRRRVAAVPRPPAASGGRGGRDGRGRGEPGGFDRGARSARVALWLTLAAVTMFFAGFTSTYLVRRSQPDWEVGPLPWLFWVNTAVLVASSVTVERARRAARRGEVEAAQRGLRWTVGLSLVFVAGQAAAWLQLARAGAFMATSPHAAFVYLLSGAHAAHVLGGVAALVWALVRARRAPSAPGSALTADLAATYWHFVDVLWLYLFALLYAL